MDKQLYLRVIFASVLASAPALGQSLPLSSGTSFVGANSNSGAFTTPGAAANAGSVSSIGASGFGLVGQTGTPGQVTGVQVGAGAQATPGGAALAASHVVTGTGAAYGAMAGAIGGQPPVFVFSNPNAIGGGIGNFSVIVPVR